MDKFCNRLKELREELGLSQLALERALDSKISASAIGRWARNDRVPNLDAVIILADFFKVSLDYIAGRED